jgi:hypothetical protein
MEYIPLTYYLQFLVFGGYFKLLKYDDFLNNVVMNNRIPEDDQICASIISNVLNPRGESRTASSSKSTLGIRNEVYALRQLMLGRPISTTTRISRIASSASNTYPIRGIGPNKVYELRRLLFRRHG